MPNDTPIGGVTFDNYPPLDPPRQLDPARSQPVRLGPDPSRSQPVRTGPDPSRAQGVRVGG